MYISNYKESDGALQQERSGYFAMLNVNGKSEVCFISGDNDIQTMEELINNFGYTVSSLLNRRIVISIEDYLVNKEISSCDECCYYKYVHCLGYDCFHPDAPEEEDRGEEPLAENAEGDFPIWCPLKKKE